MYKFIISQNGNDDFDIEVHTKEGKGKEWKSIEDPKKIDVRGIHRAFRRSDNALRNYLVNKMHNGGSNNG